MLSCLNQERNQIKHCLKGKTVQNKSVGVFWCERTIRDGLFHWRKRYYELWTHILARRDGLKLQRLNGFVSYKHTAFGFTRHQLPCLVKQKAWWTGVVWITCGLLWCFFISCLDSHSDGTHSLQIWWRNKLIYILDGLRVSKCSANLYFWVRVRTPGLPTPKLKLQVTSPFPITVIHGLPTKFRRACLSSPLVSCHSSCRIDALICLVSETCDSSVSLDAGGKASESTVSSLCAKCVALCQVLSRYPPIYR